MDPQRPTPTLGDTELTRKTLTRWFAGRMPHAADIAIAGLQIPEGNGMSNVTVLFTLSYTAGGKRHERACVGRFEPEGGGPAFPEYDLGLQYRVMDVLGSSTSVPVPALLGLEEDLSVMGVPFYIMERVDGIVPSDMPPYHMEGWMVTDIGPAQRRSLWLAGVATMAAIHRLDYDGLGLGFVESHEPGGTALEKQLYYWRRYLEWCMQGDEHPLAERALAWLFANQPNNELTRLCWGDSRPGNMLFGRDYQSVNAVLDWEMVTLGHPVQDLAWWNFLDRTFCEGLNVPRLEGLPSRDETIAFWERETGLGADNYAYYEVFAGMRYTLILTRLMKHMGIEEMVFNHHVAPLLAADLEALGG